MAVQTCNSTTAFDLASDNRKTGPTETLGRFFSKITNIFRRNLQAHRTYKTNREAFRHMLELEDNILQDIGVTRDDVLWASKLPRSKNAAIELNHVARAKRSRG